MLVIKQTEQFKKRFLEILDNQPYNTISVLDKADIMFNHISVFPYMFAKIISYDGVSIRKAYLKPFNVFYLIDNEKKEIVILKIAHYREYYKY